MKTLSLKYFLLILCLATFILAEAQDFQGQAYYFSKTPMDLGRYGDKMSDQRKKEVAARLKNRLEKTYILTFNREASIFEEDEKLDAISGATDSWGANFTPGLQYKNIKTNTLLQEQEFYGKRFLVTDSIQALKWVMGAETKMIGQYTCFKAVSNMPKSELNWWSFSWSKLRTSENKKDGDTINNTANKPEDLNTDNTTEIIEMAQIEAWYTPQIPVSHGPLEYWGLPGLILEVNMGSTTILCSKVILNPKEKAKIEAPKKGAVVSKDEYQEIIIKKMTEFRANRGRRRG